MQTRYSFNNKYILQWKNINVIKSIGLISKLQKPVIILTFNFINLKSKDFLNLIEAIYFLEVISGQRPYLQKIQNKKKIGNVGISFKIQVHLRRFYAQNWLDLLKEFILNIILKEEAINFAIKFTKFGNCFFLLKDLSFIPGLFDEGLYWKIPLKIDMLYKSNGFINIKLILEQLGFIK